MKRAGGPPRWSLVRDGKHAALEDVEWADWDPRTNDLPFARGHRLFRCPINPEKKLLKILPTARQLADFSDLSFTERVAPPEATRWPAPLTSMPVS